MQSNSPIEFTLKYQNEVNSYVHTGTARGLDAEHTLNGNEAFTDITLEGAVFTTGVKENKAKVEYTARVAVAKLTEREIEKARDLAGVDKDTEFEIICPRENEVVVIFRWSD